jgi:hypothetical protein
VAKVDKFIGRNSSIVEAAHYGSFSSGVGACSGRLNSWIALEEDVDWEESRLAIGAFLTHEFIY